MAVLLQRQIDKVREAMRSKRSPAAPTQMDLHASLALHGCALVAESGMDSAWMAAHTPAVTVDHAIVSAGTDPASGDQNLAFNLAIIRARVHAARWTYVASLYHPDAAKIVCALGPVRALQPVEGRQASALLRSAGPYDRSRSVSLLRLADFL